MTEDGKYKLVMISDIILARSGVGGATRNFVKHLDKTDKFDITMLGGAVQHKDYNPIKIEEFDNVKIIPVDSYGNKDIMRQVLDFEKPDAIWKITDPRFYYWLYEMESEIHQQCPIVWWTLWDNYKADEFEGTDDWPKYNKWMYDACDCLLPINKLTYSFLCKHGYEDKTTYIPHGVSEESFYSLEEEQVKNLKTTHVGDGKEDAFVLFYNSRNAMRKRTGTCLMAFREFLKMLPEEERENVMLCMKTPVKDPEGQDLQAIVENMGLKGRVAFADGKFNDEQMNEFYNMADCTISLSSEEGFGLSVLESLMVGTPVICTKTGGMQDQVYDPETEEEFGKLLEPDARHLIGSQTTPYIYQDLVDHKKAAKAIHEIYRRYKTNGDHKQYYAGERARKSMLRRFNLKEVNETMEKKIIETIEQFKKQKEEKKVEVISV